MQVLKTDFVCVAFQPVDISSALTERTLAQKRLTENTFDLEAMCLLNRAQERVGYNFFLLVFQVLFDTYMVAEDTLYIKKNHYSVYILWPYSF